MVNSISFQTIYKKRYLGNLVIEDDRVVQQLFPGGYFDAGGNAYYYLTDYQGNVTGVIDSGAKIVQETGYYPYGEPWLEPEGDNPYLYGGKERMALGGVRYSDFGPRLLSTASGYWGSPDPLCEDFRDLSPYINCAANPVRNIDPTGEDIVVLNYTEGMHLAMLIQNEEGKWQYYSVNGNNKYSSGSHTGGRTFNDVAVGSWDTPQEFLNSSYNVRNDNSKDNESESHYEFTEGYQIHTTQSQDATMRESFSETAETEYDLFNNNCATAVQRAMLDAGIPVSENSIVPTFIPMSTPFGIVDVCNGYKINYDKMKVIPKSAFQSIMKYNPTGAYLQK